MTVREEMSRLFEKANSELEERQMLLFLCGAYGIMGRRATMKTNKLINEDLEKMIRSNK